MIDNQDVVDLLFGIDLVGDEAYFDWNFYAPIFSEWRKSGKMIRAHVGESQSASNVVDAVNKLHVTNIAHGIKIYDDRHIIDAIRGIDVTFDMAITSNYLTGVWTDTNDHPITSMMRDGLQITIGSDDPVQCSTTLNDEYALLQKLQIPDSYSSMIKERALINTLKFKPDFNAG